MCPNGTTGAVLVIPFPPDVFQQWCLTVASCEEVQVTVGIPVRDDVILRLEASNLGACLGTLRRVILASFSGHLGAYRGTLGCFGALRVGPNRLYLQQF